MLAEKILSTSCIGFLVAVMSAINDEFRQKLVALANGGLWGEASTFASGTMRWTNGMMESFGTQGGDQQDQWTLQVFLNLVEFGMGVQEAIEAARFSSVHFPSSFHPHGAVAGGLRLEGRVSATVRSELDERGHVVEVEGDWVAGDVLAIVVDERQGVLRGGADPRGEVNRRMPSYANGW